MTTPDPDTVRARPTVQQYSPGSETYPGDTSGEGWVLFAGVMLAMLATLNVIEGIAAVSTSTFFVNDAKYILSDLNTWGWALIVLGVIQGLTAIGVWMKVKSIRWVGVDDRGPQRHRADVLHPGLPTPVADALHARHPRHLRPHRARLEDQQRLTLIPTVSPARRRGTPERDEVGAG